MSESERYERARRQVLRIKQFYYHLAAYVIVNVGLFLLDLVTSPGRFWFQWVLFGWGIALFAQWITIFHPGAMLGADWEERKIRELLAREEEERGGRGSS